MLRRGKGGLNGPQCTCQVAAVRSLNGSPIGRRSESALSRQATEENTLSARAAFLKNPTKRARELEEVCDMFVVPHTNRHQYTQVRARQNMSPANSTKEKRERKSFGKFFHPSNSGNILFFFGTPRACTGNKRHTHTETRAIDILTITECNVMDRSCTRCVSASSPL